MRGNKVGIMFLSLSAILVVPTADAMAQYNLGAMYDKGIGVKKDFSEAVKWYRKAADQGHSSAQNNLGVCYNNGEGVSQDYAEAIRWYQKAAEQGDLDAQYKLGKIYYVGKKATKNYPTAFKWLSLAAAQGSKDGAQMLDKLKKDMSSAEITEGQRLVREFKPSKT